MEAVMTEDPDTQPAAPREEERGEPSAAPPADAEAVTQDEKTQPERVVQDAYVARRLEQEAAERARVTRQAENAAERNEDAASDSPVGFYLALGVMVAAVLLVVIWLAGTRPEATATLIDRRPPAAGSREAPAALPGPARQPLPGASPGMAPGARSPTPPP
jgi:hypothetical protein